MWTNCERVLGRKPLQQQCGLIGYQPPAFNKEALRRQLVDKASRMLKERGDKWEKTCFSDAVHPSLLWAGGGSEADLRSDVFLSEKHSGGVGGIQIRCGFDRHCEKEKHKCNMCSQYVRDVRPDDEALCFHTRGEVMLSLDNSLCCHCGREDVGRGFKLLQCHQLQT